MSYPMPTAAPAPLVAHLQPQVHAGPMNTNSTTSTAPADLFSQACAPAEDAATVRYAIALLKVLQRHRYRCGSERELQDGLEHVLAAAGVPYERERALSKPDRPDFVVAGGIAIEVKTKGSLQDLLRQVSRYAQHTEVRAVLCVGTPSWLTRVAARLHGKPLFGLRLLNSLI